MNLDTKKLVDWYQYHKRELPWRKTKDPYLIWVSEIILQQTRVAQGTPYFYRFVEYFPNLKSLANAEEQEVLNLWQGLGYYSRARNMLDAARYIWFELNGKFPEKAQELEKIKGIGPYTSAAIASIAFSEPIPAIDGNVMRVLSRFHGIDEPIDGKKGRKLIEEFALDALDPALPGDFNQAMMELGARICLPKNPHCSICPLFDSCEAYLCGKVHLFPIKKSKTKVKTQYLDFFYIRYRKDVLIEKRTRGFWRGLYQFPLVESMDSNLELEVVMTYLKQHGFESASIQPSPTDIVHLLSHRKLMARFWKVGINEKQKFHSKQVWVSTVKLDDYPMSRLLEKFLENS
jgi:A/G-specific adenine glycosylase